MQTTNHTMTTKNYTVTFRATQEDCWGNEFVRWHVQDCASLERAIETAIANLWECIPDGAKPHSVIEWTWEEDAPTYETCTGVKPR